MLVKWQIHSADIIRLCHHNIDDHLSEGGLLFFLATAFADRKTKEKELGMDTAPC